MDLALVLAVVGAVTVVAGLGFVGLQMRQKGESYRDRYSQSRGFDANAGPVKLNLSTTFPGLIVLGLGVLLLIIAALVGP